MYAPGTLTDTLMNSKRVSVRINDLVTSLSPKEAAATLTIAELGLSVMGGASAQDLHQDNMSWFNQGDLVDALGISSMAARGLMTFLNRKGIAVDNGKQGQKVDGKDLDRWSLSEHGINVAEALMRGKLNNVGDYTLTIDTHGTANGG